MSILYGWINNPGLGPEKEHLGLMVRGDDDLLCNEALWNSFRSHQESEVFVREYYERGQLIAEKITDQATETLRESLESLEAITADLPETNVREHSMLWLYVRSLSNELTIRKRAEADPAYGEKIKAEREAQARQRKAKQEAREYLERTKPRAS